MNCSSLHFHSSMHAFRAFRTKAAFTAVAALSSATLYAQTAPVAALPAPAVAAAPTTTPAAIPAKAAGKIRIGVATPSVQMGQGAGSGPALAEPFRATIIGYLSGPPFEILPIVAMLPKQIEGEAREKNCDFILYSSMTQKQGGGGLGSLKTLSMLASAVPMVGMAGGMAGAMTGAMAGSALSGAAGLTSGVKAKSQVSLEYKLVKASDGTSVDANTLKQKAKQDGDDVITPLIQQAATSIREREILAALEHPGSPAFSTAAAKMAVRTWSWSTSTACPSPSMLTSTT